MEDKLKIAVFIDFDNIEIGVKSTLQREFDVAAVLDALKERGEIVTKIAYANWDGRKARRGNWPSMLFRWCSATRRREATRTARISIWRSTRSEMAFTHDHINAFAIVSGDSDFIALVNKLKQYNKIIFVVGGRAFTSTILQKNCHEFVSYESLLVDTRASSAASAISINRTAADSSRARARARPGGQHRGGRVRRRSIWRSPMPLRRARAASARTPRSASAARAFEVHHAAARFDLQ